MKATLWLLTALAALLSATNNVSALQYDDSRTLQDNFLIPQKRTKPSLSIVNPLDVLRQRIILEMARRQMRENTKQVEINKAYLKNIGKRGQLNGDTNNAQDYTVFDDFERHLIDTNSVRTNYDDNPSNIKYFNNHLPNFYLSKNPNRSNQKFPTMENIKNRLTNKNVNNANTIMDDDIDNNNNNIDNALINPQNSITNKSTNDKINKNNKLDLFQNTKADGNAFIENSGTNNDIPGLVGNGNDDDNFQMKYIYSLYKNRYNVNNV